MIEKWFCLKCDNCGEVVNYWLRDSVQDAIEAEKENGPPSIASWNGNCFCDKKCRKEWLEKRRRVREKQKAMDKMMEKFV